MQHTRQILSIYREPGLPVEETPRLQVWKMLLFTGIKPKRYSSIGSNVFIVLEGLSAQAELLRTEIECRSDVAVCKLEPVVA